MMPLLPLCACLSRSRENVCESSLSCPLQYIKAVSHSASSSIVDRSVLALLRSLCTPVERPIVEIFEGRSRHRAQEGLGK